MAIYCGSEFQADHALQTLYLKNPNYLGYADTQNPYSPPANMLFSSTSAVEQAALSSGQVEPHAPLSQAQQFVGAHDPNGPSSVLGRQEEIVQAAHKRFLYNLWGSADQSANGNKPNMAQQKPQGLSLSLAPHQTGFKNSLSVDHQDIEGPSPIGNGVKNMQSVILGSKYLKAAQQLLEEVANVREGIDSDHRPEGSKDKAKKQSICMTAAGASSGGGGNCGKSGHEITNSQRQELQMKRAKLVSMLDEVDQRYRQYHHQAQMVAASFEQTAGMGATKLYTQLALKTISKQFRCLKDAISAQIKALSRSLGLEENSGEKFVDHLFRRQRALQQLGMAPGNNVYRGRRGLPERAVSVLRVWLFEHFLHPYPRDSDKQMLARQTRLTRGQVSNWFINARVRLWKPMIEELYLEEIKNNNVQEQTTSDRENTTRTTVPDGNELASKFTARHHKNGTKIAENNPKRPRRIDLVHDNPGSSSFFSAETERKAGETTRGSRNYSSKAAPSTSRIENPGRFTNNAQQWVPTGFHGNTNNVSLTLGLPLSETLDLSEGTRRQNFIADRQNFGFGVDIHTEAANDYSNRFNAIQSATHSNISYGILDFQDRKEHFAAQFLPDFVA